MMLPYGQTMFACGETEHNQRKTKDGKVSRPLWFYSVCAKRNIIGRKPTSFAEGNIVCGVAATSFARSATSFI